MLTAKELKLLEGNTIWVLPEQNAIRRGQPLKEQIKEMKLIKMGRTKMTISEMGYDRLLIYPCDGSMTNANYGYKPFATEQDALNHLLGKEIINNIKYMYNLSHLSYEELKAIEAIIGK